MGPLSRQNQEDGLKNQRGQIFMRIRFYGLTALAAAGLWMPVLAFAGASPAAPAAVPAIAATSPPAPSPAPAANPAPGGNADPSAPVRGADKVLHAPFSDLSRDNAAHGDMQDL